MLLWHVVTLGLFATRAAQLTRSIHSFSSFPRVGTLSLLQLTETQQRECDAARAAVQGHGCYDVNDFSNLARTETVNGRNVTVLPSLSARDDTALGRCGQFSDCSFAEFEQLYATYQTSCGKSEGKGFASTITTAELVIGVCRDQLNIEEDTENCFLQLAGALWYESRGEFDLQARDFCGMSEACHVRVDNIAVEVGERSANCSIENFRFTCAVDPDFGTFCLADFDSLDYPRYCGGNCPSIWDRTIAESTCEFSESDSLSCFRDSQIGCPSQSQEETRTLCYGNDQASLRPLLMNECNVNLSAGTADCSDGCREVAHRQVRDRGCCFSTVLRNCEAEGDQFSPWAIISEACEGVELGENDLPLPELPDSCALLIAATMAPVVAASAACCGFPWF